MRKILAVLFALAVTNLLVAQTQVGDANSPIYHNGTGNVGIGTNSPNATLEVNGRLALFGSDTSYLNGEIVLGSNINSPTWHIDEGDGHDRFRIYRLDSYYGTGGEMFVIKNNGAVGIGTHDPAAMLHVQHTNGGFLKLRPADGALEIGSGNDGFSYIDFNGNDNLVKDFQNRIGSDNRGVFIYTNSGIDVKFAVLHDGNVGIGTAYPTHKLSVNGTIRAKEIIVDNNNWPDYVFESDYNLRELSEVQDFINKNGHLPDVPSAQSVHENGVSLAELNATLLQKVEELTLYIIDQQKQIDELKIAVSND